MSVLICHSGFDSKNCCMRTKCGKVSFVFIVHMQWNNGCNVNMTTSTFDNLMVKVKKQLDMDGRDRHQQQTAAED